MKIETAFGVNPAQVFGVRCTPEQADIDAIRRDVTAATQGQLTPEQVDKLVNDAVSAIASPPRQPSSGALASSTVLALQLQSLAKRMERLENAPSMPRPPGPTSGGQYPSSEALLSQRVAEYGQWLDLLQRQFSYLNTLSVGDGTGEALKRSHNGRIAQLESAVGQLTKAITTARSGVNTATHRLSVLERVTPEDVPDLRAVVAEQAKRIAALESRMALPARTEARTSKSKRLDGVVVGAPLDDTTLPGRIERILRERGIGQRELSKRSGLDPVHVSKFLHRARRNARASIEAPTVEAIAKGGNVSVRWLLTGEGRPDECAQGCPWITTGEHSLNCWHVNSPFTPPRVSARFVAGGRDELLADARRRAQQRADADADSTSLAAPVADPTKARAARSAKPASAAATPSAHRPGKPAPPDTLESLAREITRTRGGAVGVYTTILRREIKCRFEPTPWSGLDDLPQDLSSRVDAYVARGRARRQKAAKAAKNERARSRRAARKVAAA